MAGTTAPQRTAPQRADPQRAATHRPPPRSTFARSSVGRLQQSVGNQVIHRLLQTRAIQPKLTVGPVDDEYEREADRVADEIVRMPDPSADLTAQRASPAIQRLCPECEEEEEGEELQRAPVQVQRVCAECEEELQRTPDPVQRMCPECEEELQRTAAAPSQSTPDRVSRKCPACEEEARLATEESTVQRQPIPIEEIEEEDKQDEAQLRNGGVAVQTKRAGSDPPDTSPELAAYIEGSRGGGEPLPFQTRVQFESRFGHAFGGVRVHTNARAAEAAADIKAYAFTTGSDIYFGAGRFQPGTPEGDHLLAHELTHTIQQTGGQRLAPPAGASGSVQPSPERSTDSSRGGDVTRTAGHDVQRWPSSDEVLDVLEDTVSTAAEVGEGALDTAGGVVSDAADTVGDALEGAGEALDDAADAVVDTAGDVGEAIGDAGGAVIEAAGDALDWLETEAGQLALAIADALDGIIVITPEGLLITVPEVCPLPALTFPFDLPSMDGELMAPVIVVPIGPVVLIGSLGVAGHLQPHVEVQLGPICLQALRVLINPLTGTFSISGGISATAALGLAAEVRGGVRGALSLAGVVPIGGVPVPISVDLAGVEGGVAGLVRGIGAARLTIGGGLRIGGGGLITLQQSRQLDVGLAADLFAGAYGQVDLLGEKICRIYWQPYEWHGDLAASIGISMGVTIVPGGVPAIIPIVSPPTITPIPFNQIPLALSRQGFSDDCPIVDTVCQVLDDLSLLPSQNGGVWNWSGPYGPGPRLTGPLDVYEMNPGIPSGAKCRGACGVNCDPCEHIASFLYVDPLTGDVWEYLNFEDCSTNEGCREHDAAFDWAADVHGEVGPGAIVMPWHMAANVECACNNLAGNCIAWALGYPPYDGTIFFATSSRLVSHGGAGAIGSGACREDFPNAPGCIASYPAKEDILFGWGLLNGIDNFGSCYIAEDYTAASMLDCEGGPGRVWHCPATDLGTGESVIVGITECICCHDDDTAGSIWSAPTIVVFDGMPIELILELCDRGLIARETCVPIEEASSTAVPSLDNRTWYLAHRAIQSGDLELAFRTVLDRLVARGLVNLSLADWSFVDRSDVGEGRTTFTWQEDPQTHDRRAIAPSSVEIYTPALADVGLLFSTMMHEYVHVLDAAAGLPAAAFDPATGLRLPEYREAFEVEAYLWEIEHAVGTGLINNPQQLQDVADRLTDHFDALTDDLKARYQARYDAAQQLVVTTIASGPPMPIDEARRIVQESSRQIAELLRQRPDNPDVIDAQIEAIRRQREQALIQVALVDNPIIQVVRPGEPGTYRVPTLDAQGQVRFLHGGIQVAWHLAQATTSAYTLGEAIGVGGDVAIAGTAIQGRVHPFPPDVDFDEHIHVIADTPQEAGRLVARRLIAGIRRISGGPVPGRTDLEFRHLLTFPRGGGRKFSMSLGEVLRPDAESRLAPRVAELNGGNMNTFWRGFLDDGRFTNVTRVVFVSANRRDGTVLIDATGNADFNLAYLEDPGQIPTTSLADFAWEMCCAAVDRAGRGAWLKAAKRAYNYFSTIGDTVHMAELEPVFRQPQAEAEQYATVIDAISRTLVMVDMRVRQARTRILTLDEARDQVERVARVVETTLPNTGARPSPTEIAANLRARAGELQSRNARGHLAQDPRLGDAFKRLASQMRVHIDGGIRAVVKPIIDNHVAPVCPTERCEQQAAAPPAAGAQGPNPQPRRQGP